MTAMTTAQTTSNRSRERCAAARCGRAACARHQTPAPARRRGRACVSALFYNARDPLERYNMPDTLKAQYTAFLTAGRVLYSDMGRDPVLDRRGHLRLARHDLGHRRRRRGARSATATARYQELRNDFHRNAPRQLLVELGKYGLGKRDIVANVNFFVRGRRRRRRRAGLGAGQQPRRARPSSCAARWTCWWCCRTRRTRSIPAPHYAAAAGRADDQRRATARRRTIAAGCRAPRTGAASQLTEAYVRGDGGDPR